jgi:hypothetical protein
MQAFRSRPVRPISGDSTTLMTRPENHVYCNPMIHVRLFASLGPSATCTRILAGGFSPKPTQASSDAITQDLLVWCASGTSTRRRNSIRSGG